MFDDDDDFPDDGWDDADESDDPDDLDDPDEFAAFLAADWAIDGDFFGLWGL